MLICEQFRANYLIIFLNWCKFDCKILPLLPFNSIGCFITYRFSSRRFGPYYHSIAAKMFLLSNPHIMASAGFFSDVRCYHWYEPTSPWEVAILLLTNVFSKYGVFKIHAKEIVESVQRITFSIWTLNHVRAFCFILVNRRHKPNSKWGTDENVMVQP